MGMGEFQKQQLALTQKRIDEIAQLQRLTPDISRLEISNILGISVSNVGKLINRMKKDT